MSFTVITYFRPKDARDAEWEELDRRTCYTEALAMKRATPPAFVVSTDEGLFDVKREIQVGD